MLDKVHSRIKRWTVQPYWWIILGGLMAFLGYAVVDTSGGNCFHKNHYPDAGVMLFLRHLKDFISIKF